VGGWATIIENLGSMGIIITLQMVKRFACNPTKGFLQTYEGNQSSLLTKRRCFQIERKKPPFGVVLCIACRVKGEALDKVISQNTRLY
jgi:hypothetical protein